MKRDDWLEIMNRLSVGSIPEFDATGGDGFGQVCDPAGSGGRKKMLPAVAFVHAPDSRPVGNTAVAPSKRESHLVDIAAPPTTSRLWPFEGQGEARFGLRVRSAPADVRPVAARLAAAAADRNTAPVILSHVHRSGFEHLGFRVERIHAGTDAEEKAQEDELKAFWDLAVVVDFEDVGGLC